jgi:hypothetical protein
MFQVLARERSNIQAVMSSRISMQVGPAWSPDCEWHFSLL